VSNFKRSQAKHVKQTHKITNWAAYDQALVNRGSLTFWFTNEAISKWTAPASGKAGGQRKFSDLAIETALAFRMVFHLPWRQTFSGGFGGIQLGRVGGSTSSEVVTWISRRDRDPPWCGSSGSNHR
jgi:hypothetical protein